MSGRLLIWFSQIGYGGVMKPNKWKVRVLIVFLACMTLGWVGFTHSRAFAGEQFNIALVPEKNIYEQRQRYGIIAQYLSNYLDMDVRIVIMPTYSKICDAFLDGTVDAGFFGSFSYVLTRAKASVEPIARPVWLDGSSTYSGYIFVRKDSGIKTVADMKNKRLALVDRMTTAGYIFQRVYFKKKGVADLDNHFRDVFFAGSHDASAWAVYTGEADVGGGKNHIFHALEKEYPDFQEKMRIIARSTDVPSNGLVVRADLDPLLKKRLKELFLGLDDSPEGRTVLKKFGARRFIENPNRDYRLLYKMIEELELDLAEY